MSMNQSKAQIVATIGPASSEISTLVSMMRAGMDVVRLNFSWGDEAIKAEQIKLIREASKIAGKNIPIIADIPGPRIKLETGHAFDPSSPVITQQDEAFICFALNHGVDYIAASFIANADHVRAYKRIIADLGGSQSVIAKIERAEALQNIEAIAEAADAIMVARGDLGDNIPLEEVPFAQATIIKAAKKAGKPVITATQMLLSMVENPTPTRAEVTDVANAILLGSDAVMLSEESARGKYPVESVAMMERIVKASERHLGAVSYDSL